MSNWDAETQGWESIVYSATLGWDEPFTAEVNGAYMITVQVDAAEVIDVVLKGTIPESPVYNILETQTTDLNFIMVPYDFTDNWGVSGDVMASDLGNDMGTDNTIMISKWDAASQSWISCVYIAGLHNWLNNYQIEAGMSIVVGAVQNFTWPNN